MAAMLVFIRALARAVFISADRASIIRRCGYIVAVGMSCLVRLGSVAIPFRGTSVPVVRFIFAPLVGLVVGMRCLGKDRRFAV